MPNDPNFQTKKKKKKKLSNDPSLTSNLNEITKINSGIRKISSHSHSRWWSTCEYLSNNLWTSIAESRHRKWVILALSLSRSSFPHFTYHLALLTSGACAWFFVEVGSVGEEEGGGKREKKTVLPKLDVPVKKKRERGEKNKKKKGF